MVETDSFQNYVDKNETQIVFINGVLSEEFTNLGNVPKGIEILPLKEALKSKEKTIKSVLEKYDSKDETAFQSLNNALISEGVYVEIQKGTIDENLIHIVHVTSNENKSIISNPRTIIVSNTSSEATILESHVAFNDELTYFTNPLTDIYLYENATLHYCKAQKESLKAYHIGNTRIWQERSSNFDGFTLMAGSAINRNNLDVVLDGEGIDSTLNGLYSIFDDQHVDNHTAVDHRFPNCTSNQLYKGVLNGSSRAVFNGKIFVKDIAQQTNSYQLNKNLLLGTDCRVDTKPQLEIFADDVKCTHGATIGQLNEDEIFYLQSRCVSKDEAKRMLARGFVDELVNQFKNDSINKKLHILLEPSFQKL